MVAAAAPVLAPIATAAESPRAQARHSERFVRSNSSTSGFEEGFASSRQNSKIPILDSGYGSAAPATISEAAPLAEQAGPEKDWHEVFKQLQDDGEMHKDKLMLALELCDVDRPSRLWAENVLTTITRFTTLGMDEFVAFIKAYIIRQRLAYKEAFKAVDFDGSGQLDRDELAAVLRSMGMDVMRHVMDEVIGEVQQDEEVGLNLDEFEVCLDLLQDRDGFSKDEYDTFTLVFHTLQNSSPNGFAQRLFSDAFNYLGIAIDAAGIDEVLKEMRMSGGNHHLRFSEFRHALRKVRQRELRMLKDAFRENKLSGEHVAFEDVRPLLVSVGYLAPDLVAFREAALESGAVSDGTLDFPHDFWQALTAYRQREFMSNADAAEVKKAFEHYDKSCSGAISSLDLGKVLRCLGIRVPFEVQQQAMKAVDIAETGSLDRCHLHKLVRMLRQRDVDTLREMWCADLVDGEVEATAVRPTEDLAVLLGPLGSSDAQAGIKILPDERAAARNPLGPDEFDIGVFLAVSVRLLREARENFKSNGGFTAVEVVHLKESFRGFDVDGSGDISNKELILLIEEIFPDMASSADMRPQLLEIMREVDMDGSGTLNFEDFMNLMKQLRDLQDRERFAKELQVIHETDFTAQEVADFRDLFMAADEESSGVLHITPVIAMIKQITPVGDKSKAEFSELFHEAVTHRARPRDCSLDVADFPEFLWMMKLLLDRNFGNIRERTATVGGVVMQGGAG